MGLKFLERDERVLYISEALEEYKAIWGISDLSELPCLYKKRKRPAVLVIDEQYAFTSSDSVGGTKLLGEEARQLINGMVESTKILLDAARQKNIPIFYFYVSRRQDGADNGIMEERNPSLAGLTPEGTKMVEIDERIKPHKGDFVMEKKRPSAFFGTPLDNILKHLGIDVNIAVGNSTSGCVRATVVDSVQNGYCTLIPEGCIADRIIGAHKANLFDMMMKLADVASLEDVLSWIRSLG